MTQKTAPAPDPGGRMSPENIITKRRHEPDRILLYGVEKVGKSTFGASARRPIFIAADEGTGHLDVPRFPEPRTFEEVLQCIQILALKDLPYDTLVLDTIGWIDHLIRDHICRKLRWTKAKYQEYYRGVKIAIDEHRTLVGYLSRLRALKGIEIILIAHAEVKEFKNPQGADFMYYKIQMEGEKAPDVYKQWADSILFANWEVVVTDEDDKRPKGVSTGNRILYTMKRPAFEAGNRWGISTDLVVPNEPKQVYATYARARAEAGVYLEKGAKK